MKKEKDTLVFKDLPKSASAMNPKEMNVTIQDPKEEKRKAIRCKSEISDSKEMQLHKQKLRVRVYDIKAEIAYISGSVSAMTKREHPNIYNTLKQKFKLIKEALNEIEQEFINE